MQGVPSMPHATAPAMLQSHVQPASGPALQHLLDMTGVLGTHTGRQQQQQQQHHHHSLLQASTQPTHIPTLDPALGGLLQQVQGLTSKLPAAGASQASGMLASQQHAHGSNTPASTAVQTPIGLSPHLLLALNGSLPALPAVQAPGGLLQLQLQALSSNLPVPPGGQVPVGPSQQRHAFSRPPMPAHTATRQHHQQQRRRLVAYHNSSMLPTACHSPHRRCSPHTAARQHHQQQRRRAMVYHSSTMPLISCHSQRSCCSHLTVACQHHSSSADA